MAETQAAGAIYDLGYQRYAGERLGRTYAFRTLLAYSFRAAFGIGRGDKAKQLPQLVCVLVYLPAMVQIGVASLAGSSQGIHYSDFLQITAYFLALFAAGQASELLVTDKQQGTLALYLSRPLGAIDYALAKLAALTGAMLVITLGPQLVLFLGRVFVTDKPWATFVGEWPNLVPIVGGTLLVSLFFAAIGLALSSLASRRAYATSAVIAFFLFSAAIAEMIRAVAFGPMQRYAVLGNPALLIRGFATWLFEVRAPRYTALGRAALPGQLYLYVILTVTAIAIAILLRRYHRGEA